MRKDQEEREMQTHEILSISLGARGLPLRCIVPPDAKTFRVDIRSRRVDFPAPEGPMIAVKNREEEEQSDKEGQKR